MITNQGGKSQKKRNRKIGVKFLVKNHKSREKITILNPPKTGSISQFRVKKYQIGVNNHKLQVILYK